MPTVAFYFSAGSFKKKVCGGEQRVPDQQGTPANSEQVQQEVPSAGEEGLCLVGGICSPKSLYLFPNHVGNSDGYELLFPRKFLAQFEKHQAFPFSPLAIENLKGVYVGMK